MTDNTSRATYIATIRSIRDNGLRYATQHAINTNDNAALLVCDELANIMKSTDWLAMRAQFIRTGGTNHAFRLTTTVTKTATN